MSRGGILRNISRTCKMSSISLYASHSPAFDVQPSQSPESLQRPTEKPALTDPQHAEIPLPLTVGADEVLEFNDLDSESECHEVSYTLSESSDISASRSVTPSSAPLSITPSSSFAESSCCQSLSSTVNVVLVVQIQFAKLALRSTLG